MIKYQRLYVEWTGRKEPSLSFELCIPNNANQITELATLPVQHGRDVCVRDNWQCFQSRGGYIIVNLSADAHVRSVHRL